MGRGVSADSQREWYIPVDIDCIVMGITYSPFLFPVKHCTLGRHLRDVSRMLEQLIITSPKLTLSRRSFHCFGTPKEIIGTQA